MIARNTDGRIYDLSLYRRVTSHVDAVDIQVGRIVGVFSDEVDLVVYIVFKCWVIQIQKKKLKRGDSANTVPMRYTYVRVL